MPFGKQKTIICFKECNQIMVCTLKSMKGQIWGGGVVQIDESFNIQKAKCCSSEGPPFWTLRRPSRAGRVKTTETMQVRDVGERIQRSYQSKVRLGYGPITNVSLQTPGGALEGQAASISLACPGKWLMLVHAILGGLR